MWRSAWFQITVLSLIALGIRLAWGLNQLSLGIEFVEQGDYALYRIGAEHFLAEGDFSNSLFLVRPPAFSLVVAALGLNNQAVLIFNAVLGALLVPLTYALTRQFGLGHGVGLVAAIIVTIDPLTVRYTAYLGPESLAFLGALAMIVCLMALRRAASLWAASLWALAAAVMFLVSVYARPSIYILWLFLVLWLLVVSRRHWPALLIYALVCIGGTQIWVQHNAQVFGNPTFSSVAAYTMTYYRAVSVANLATELTVREAELDIARRVEEKLGRDPSAVDEDTKHGYLAASPQVEQALQEVSLEIFRTYPLTYIATLPLGFVRLYQLMPSSVPPLSELLNLSEYPPVIWNWLGLLLAVYGLYRAARERRWFFFCCIFLLFGYFTAGTLLTKSAGLSGRERTIVFPYMAIACAYGAAQLRMKIYSFLRRSTSMNRSHSIPPGALPPR